MSLWKMSIYAPKQRQMFSLAWENQNWGNNNNNDDDDVDDDDVNKPYQPVL